MLETSKDLLFIILAFCILWFTIFLTWAIFYLVMILRNANLMISDFRKKMEKLDEIADFIKDKLGEGFASFAVLAKGFLKVVEIFRDSKKKRK